MFRDRFPVIFMQGIDCSSGAACRNRTYHKTRSFTQAYRLCNWKSCFGQWTRDYDL